MKSLKTFLLFLLIPVFVTAQNTPGAISLDYCYLQIERSYPLAQKFEIQKSIADLSDRIAKSGMFPDVQINGSASYQSDVTEVPFAANAPEFSKDHYNISLDISQPVYDGGRTGALRKLEAGQSAVEDAGLKADLWNVRMQIDQVFFGILYLQKKDESIDLLINDIGEQLSSVQSKIDNGILLPANGLILEAELLKVQQQKIQVNYDLKAAFETLGLIIGEEISPVTKLEIPLVSEEKHLSKEITRPELDVFSRQVNTLVLQQKLIATDKLPKVSAFAKTAYGRPGLNVFEDDLQTFWIVGLRAQWSLKKWNNSGTSQEVLELQKRKIQAEEDAFKIQIRSSISKSEEQIAQIREQIQMDEKVLDLREQVVAEKQKQLEQGVITSTEYLTELNAENQARLNLEIRQVQLVQAIIEYSTKKGISWN